MADLPIPPELANKLGAASERFHNAAQAHELAARMYAASQAELNAAERDMRELGRAVALMRQHAPSTTTAAASLVDELVAKLRGSPPVATAAPAAPLSDIAKEVAAGDPTAEAALRHMMTNPGQPVPGAT